MPDMREDVRRSLFYEMSESNERAMHALLSAAGFDDITLNEVLVLAALQLRGNAAMDPRQPHEMLDKLLRCGYLENKTVVTPRGNMAVAVVRDGTLASRWASFPFRPGDIVISTPSKSGTTWMQMICALLVFQTPDLPASLDDLSPWLNQPSATRHGVFEKYIAQQHRRFIKSHNPLSDIPIVSQVTYIVVGRHPLDVAVSRYFQRSRYFRDRDASHRHDYTSRRWLLEWIAEESPSVYSNTLLGTLRHISDAWERRDEPNIVLTHYGDLSADLEGQMRYLATRLGITVSEPLWPRLVQAATFEQMRAAAERIQPLGDTFKDHAAFFRRGSSGSGAELLTAAELAGYYARVARILEPDVLAWLHRSR